MNRFQTFSEQVWPDSPGMREQAIEWAQQCSEQVLGWTWRGFDTMRAKYFHLVDWSQPMEQLERDLTARHFRQIQNLWRAETDGYSTIFPIPELPELETRPKAPGKPSSPDIAFVWTDNERINFPVEAKLVKTPTALSPYLSDVEKFVSGIVAPLVGEGAMIGYLLSGSEVDMLQALETHLKMPLGIVPSFATRPHRASTHARQASPFLHLHHLVMLCN